MSLASQLRQRGEQLREQRQQEAAQEVLVKEQAREEIQARIFERAREVYDLCISAARELVARTGATEMTFPLHAGHWDNKDFPDSILMWKMVVLALEENGFLALLDFQERYQPGDELGGES